MKKMLTSINTVFYKICYYIYRFIRYVILGISFPFIYTVILITKLLKRRKTPKKIKPKEKVVVKNNKKVKQIVPEKIEKDEYINKELDIKSLKNKVPLGERISVAIEKFFKSIKEKTKNTTFLKQRHNEKIIKSNESLVNFGEDEDEALDKKVVWKYVAYDSDGKKIVGYLDAYSRVDIHSFLLSQELKPYSIETNKTIQLLHGNLSKNKSRIKNSDLIFLIAQLSTYLKSGITLVESLNILIRQTKKKSIKYILREVTQELTMGESLSKALEKQGNAFPKLLINMIKAAELTGELPETLDDMNEYYTEVEAARKQMISALTYPTIVFIFTIAVITFVLLYVVPQFVNIYSTMDDSQVPAFTMAVISVSDFLKANFFTILLIVALIGIIMVYVYKHIRIVRTLMQWIAMHIPIIGNIIIYNEVAMFSKTFSSLLAHNVFITDSMDILNKITNNEIYKMMILDTVSNLAKGEKISKAFKDQWAFPIPAYEMIVTGEKTGQLTEMMSKVSNYYQELHKNTVSRIKSLVEPILIIFLTFAVGVILLAIIIPMFNMYQQVQSLG